MFSLYSDSRETRTNLTDSFRLERGGQFESGFQGKCVPLKLIIGFSITKSRVLSLISKNFATLTTPKPWLKWPLPKKLKT